MPLKYIITFVHVVGICNPENQRMQVWRSKFLLVLLFLFVFSGYLRTIDPHHCPLIYTKEKSNNQFPKLEILTIKNFNIKCLFRYFLCMHCFEFSKPLKHYVTFIFLNLEKIDLY